jgi:hypothetical protein
VLDFPNHAFEDVGSIGIGTAADRVTLWAGRVQPNVTLDLIDGGLALVDRDPGSPLIAALR